MPARFTSKSLGFGLIALVALAILHSWALIFLAPERAGIFADAVAPALYLSLALVLLLSAPRGVDPGAIVFRRLLLGGLFAWWIAIARRLAELFFAAPAPPLLVDLVYTLSFFFFLVAAESQPDRSRDEADPLEIWSLVSSLVFLSGLFTSLVLLPAGLEPAEVGAGESRIPAFLLYATLDAYLACRFLYLAANARARRWRRLFFAAGTAFFALFVFDFGTFQLLINDLPVYFGDLRDLIWATPFWGLLVLVWLWRVEPEAVAGPPLRSDRGKIASLFSLPISWALLFPIIHIVFAAAGWLDPALAPARDRLLLIFCLALAALARLQRAFQLEQLKSLLAEKRAIQQRFRDSEEDLRLVVERTRAGSKLRTAEELFQKAFEAFPDALALARPQTGEIVELNHAFENLTHFSRSELLGRRAEDHGLWPDQRSRGELVRSLQRQAAVPKAEGSVITKSGTRRQVEASFEIVPTSNETLLLLVLRDLGRVVVDTPPTWLEALQRVNVPLLIIAGEGRLLFWNIPASGLDPSLAELPSGHPLARLERCDPESFALTFTAGTERLCLGPLRAGQGS